MWVRDRDTLEYEQVTGIAYFFSPRVDVRSWLQGGGVTRDRFLVDDTCVVCDWQRLQVSSSRD